MKLEEQVTNRQLSKKLQKLKIKRETLFSWVISRRDGETFVLDYNDSCGLCSASYNANRDKAVSAFTVAELGELLPNGVSTEKMKDGKSWCPNWSYNSLTLGIDNYVDLIKRYKNIRTEADARAILLIFLIEKKIIKV